VRGIIITPDRELGEEVANLVKTLTGYRPPSAPEGRARRTGRDARPLLEEIEQTIAAHKAGERARIVMRMNAVVASAASKRSTGFSRGRADRA
jgi:polyphosphate kinase